MNRSAALAFIAGAIAGAALAAALLRSPAAPPAAPRDAPGQAGMQPAGVTVCPAAAEISSLRNQLDICMTFHASAATEETEHTSAGEGERELTEEERRARHNQAMWNADGELVIVRRADRSLWFLPPTEPVGDAKIVGRRLPNRELIWYQNGVRVDPPEPGLPRIERAPDGTLLVNGEPADPVLQRMSQPR